MFEFTKKLGTEKQCEKFLIEKRFGGKVFCVYSNHKAVYKFADKKRFKCKEKQCSLIFSYKTGTFFENTKISLRKWFLAIYLFSSMKKEISSPQLAKYIGISQQSAWFMLHRLCEVLNGSQKEKYVWWNC